MSQLSITMEEQDFASGRMADLLKAIGPSEVYAQVGEVMREFVSDHFADLENERGGGISHFYEKASENAHLRHGADGIEIAVTAPIGIRQRILGGDISPKKAKALAWPAIPEAMGKSPREFNNLHLVWPKGWLFGMLVESGRAATIGRKKAPVASRGTPEQTKGIKDRIFFWLSGGVSQAADPTVAPNPDRAQEVLDGAVLSMLHAAA